MGFSRRDSCANREYRALSGLGLLWKGIATCRCDTLCVCERAGYRCTFPGNHMPIAEHPEPGTILRCDFDGGFRESEMVKPRLVVVLSPRIRARPQLCTVVALSTTDPDPIMPYHCRLDIAPPLPSPWQSKGIWVKEDMVYAVGFHRLDLIRLGKDTGGKRIYRMNKLAPEQIKSVRTCVLHALGLSALTKHL
jgi:mRNA interferase MazF